MNLRELRGRVERRARQAGVSLGPDLLSRLIAYFELLARWNVKMNLTSLGEPDEAIDRLLLEPVVAARYLPAGVRGVMDVGSGGGSPAIPLKLAAPYVRLWMVERKNRKAAFLREALRHLSLSEAVVETGAYEELLARPELHEAMDVVTVRALRVEAKVLRGLQAFLVPGGWLFLFRGAAGPDVPAATPPPLVWHSTYALVDSLRSRLTILRKARVGIGGP